MYQTIVVPVDGTAESEVAIPYAVELAQAFGSKVIVCHVITEPLGTKLSAAHHAAVEYIGRIEVRFQAAGVQTMWQLRRGDPSLEIQKTAVECGADAIVMATRGRTRLEKLVSASVADAVVQSCRLPVLLVSSGNQAAQSSLRNAA